MSTTKGSTRMILVHVQKMYIQKIYKTFRILIEVSDYSSSFVFFSKNEEEAIPPEGKNYLATTKASTRIILVHVQKMYKTCYSSSFFFLSKNEEEAIPPGGRRYLGTTKGSTRIILVHVQKMYKTCTEDVQYI